MATIEYDFEINKIKNKIMELDAHNIILQFPEGLKKDALNIVDSLDHEISGINIVIDADPCFGACDLADNKVNGHMDLVIHFAHTPLPIKTDIPVLFIEAHSSSDVISPINEALTTLDPGVKTVGLVTTTQHIHKLDSMIKLIEDNGYNVKLAQGKGTRPGQVLGCNFTSIKELDVDVIIYVGSGDFHALGIKLFTKKQIILADPFTGQCRNIDKFYDRIIRIRFARITKASSAKTYGIILSSKKGQLRFDLALQLKKMIEDHGYKAYILNMDYVAPDRLLPFDIDAFVMTACPRIAIDDSAMYKKPVITPEELKIVLGTKEWDEYQMDEIIIHDEQD
jgi:2-(3-amino-3-carboxypropyl)histidine synthase